jgi:serine protease Do
MPKHAYRSLIAFVATATLLASGAAVLSSSNEATAQVQAPAQVPTKMVGNTPVPSLAPMIKKVSPTVVSIATRGIARGGRGNPLLDDPFFRRFFGDQPGFNAPQEFRSAGSGVVVDAKSGYIITNAHVVENASEITVTTEDNQNFQAEVKGVDQASDVAVLKLKEKTPQLQSITLGDSSRLEVGDFVVAIGNPFGLQHTVTSGIVSALGRAPGLSRDSLEDFIQTDASINPGNSGGALVNLKGELIGINSAILSQSGGNIGIGFAIPVNMVKAVMDQIIKYGTVRRGILGVSIQTLTPDLLEGVGAPPNTQGALVSEVQAGSAAEKAGIKIGDVITSVNGQAVRSNSELRNAIGLLEIGDQVEVGLLRDGKPRKVTAKIGERAEAAIAEAAEIHRGLDGSSLADAPENGGVAVRGVENGSPAQQAGLRANDVIVSANRAPVENLAQLRQAAEGANALVLGVRRGNARLLVPVR